MKKIFLYCFLICHTPFFSYAQRGALDTQQKSPIETPLSHFPSYFDAGMTPPKKVVFDIPTFQLDYGVTEHFSLGTNGLTLLLAAFTLQPTAILKARYRFFSSHNVSSVITGYLGYLNLTTNNAPANNIWLYSGTNNTSYFFDEYNVLNFHTTALSFHSQTGNPSNLKYSKIGVETLAFGVNYLHFFSESYSAEGLIVVPAYLNLEIDNPESNSSITFTNSTVKFPFFFRFLFNWKTGPESVLSGGYWNFSNQFYGPWLSWTFIL
ncbi:hypothetical protein [Fluviispira multicolorata]|uniref:Uncharacterized protein n=1 Tax=Fluviispira multicolorata TaxID=2654512 RepID=A0A833JH55_9BACT|nr:hypothetical protein [Fluviispira multicolorata]KAB8033297.1 hypothetical protein GCL57_00960 [Fluviispira multicolorata]